jgi:uncharacterized membrane protein
MQRIETRHDFEPQGGPPGVVRRPRHPAPLDRRYAAERRGSSQPLHRAEAERLAQGLGWFSVSLGLVEMLAPRFVSRLVGGNGRYTSLIRLYGLREIANGMMIFAQGRKPAAAMWSRVAGDAVDIATLAAGAASPRTHKASLALAGVGVLGAAALDFHCAKALTNGSAAGSAIRMTRSIVVNRPVDEVYRFWHDFGNFPRFMYHVESIRASGPGLSHWVVKGPAGIDVEWDARITVDTPNEMIAWQSLEGSDVQHAGSVRFEARPDDRGTLVLVDLEYRPPGGVAGKLAAMLFSESPEQQIHDDLRRMKQVLETGEVLRSDGSPEGTGSVREQPARPAGGRR